MDERGAVFPFIMFFVVVGLCGFMWVVFNEVILHVGDIVTSDTGFAGPILLGLYRITPAALIVAAFIWAVIQAHRGDAG